MYHIKQLEDRKNELEKTKIQLMGALYSMALASIALEPQIQDNFQFLSFCFAFFTNVGGIGIISKEVDEIRWKIDDLTKGQVYGEF